MRKERYKAKCPGSILLADSVYAWGHDRNPETEEQVIEYQPPPGFEMRIELEEIGQPFDAGRLQAVMSLYFAPGERIDRDLSEQCAPYVGFAQKWVNAKTACYKAIVDEKQETVEIGENGYWSQYREYYNDARVRQTIGADILIVLPGADRLDEMRNLMYSLFEEVCPIDLEEKQSGKEKNGKMAEDISIRGTLKKLQNTEKQRTAHHRENMLLKAGTGKQVRKECKKKDPER